MPSGTWSHSAALALPSSAQAPSVWRLITWSPGLNAVTSGADGDHLAGRLAARDERRLRAELVFAGQHQHVDVLHAAGADAHGDLAGAGRRRVRAPRATPAPPDRRTPRRPWLSCRSPADVWVPVKRSRERTPRSRAARLFAKPARAVAGQNLVTKRVGKPAHRPDLACKTGHNGRATASRLRFAFPTNSSWNPLCEGKPDIERTGTDRCSRKRPETAAYRGSVHNMHVS